MGEGSVNSLKWEGATWLHYDSLSLTLLLGLGLFLVEKVLACCIY